MNWREQKAAGYVIEKCCADCDEQCQREAPEFHEWLPPRPRWTGRPDPEIVPPTPCERPPMFLSMGDEVVQRMETQFNERLAATYAEPWRPTPAEPELRVRIATPNGEVEHALGRLREVTSRVLPFYGPFLERDEAILHAYRAGASLRQLGEASGLTSERCRQIVRGAGL